MWQHLEDSKALLLKCQAMESIVFGSGKRCPTQNLGLEKQLPNKKRFSLTNSAVEARSQGACSSPAPNSGKVSTRSLSTTGRANRLSVTVFLCARLPYPFSLLYFLPFFLH